MISLYPSKLPGDAFEQYRIPAPVTVLSWIENTKSALWYWLRPNESQTGIALDLQPVSCMVNGTVIAISQWAMYGITPDDDVVFVFEAQGSIIGGAFNIIGKVFGAVFRVFTPSIKTPSTNTQVQGDQIDRANIEANQAKLNDYVAQLFGRNRRYPDLLVQTRRTYIGNKQYTFMHLCVGIGHHQINPLEVFIGNTSLASLGDDASLEIFQPGQDHSGNEATQNWYPAPEVGGTSSGDAGLDISPTFSVERSPTASSYALGPYVQGDNDDATQGGYIAIPSGAGSFPNGWAAGMEVSILAPQPVQFVKDADGYFGFVGPVDGFDYAVGDAIDIDGDIRGQQWHIIDKETDSSGDTLYWLADTKNVRPDWLKEQEYSVFITPKGGRFVITSTDAQGSWVDNDNNGVNDADEDDDDSNDNEYTPAQQIIVQYRLSDGTVSDWNGFDARSSTDAVITLSDDGSQGGWAGPFPVCPENEVTNKFEWDISFPYGLIEFGHTSDHTYAVTFPYDLQYRDMAVGGAWTTLSRSVTQKTADEYAITDSLTLDTAARYEVRIRRSSAPKGDQYTHDTGQWYGLRGLLDRPNAYEDVTSIALKVRTGARLAAQSENKVWCYATRMLPPYNDANGDLVATRDIAPAMMYMLRKLGYTNEDVDMDELGRLQAIWSQRGDTFDMQYTDETSLLDALNQALGVGYAELIIDHGRIVPIRDEARTTFDHMYSPQNMTSELKISSQLKNVNDKDQYDGIDVEYQSAITNKKETVECRLPNDSGQKVQKLTVYGITDRTRAWRWGMRQRAIQKWRARSFEWQTGFDALNSAYMDHCQVSGDYENYSQSGQVLSARANGDDLWLTLDRNVEFSEGEDYIISLRGLDGTVSSGYARPVKSINESGEVQVANPGWHINTDLKFDLTHYVYGKRSRAFWPVLIQSISPSGSPVDDQEPQVSVQAINYDERVYQYDDAVPD